MKRGPVHDKAYQDIEGNMTLFKNGVSTLAICEKHGTDWVDCILSQLQYRLKKMKSVPSLEQQWLTLKQKRYDIDVAAEGNKFFLKNLSTWLTGVGKKKIYLSPHIRNSFRGPGINLS